MRRILRVGLAAAIGAAAFVLDVSTAQAQETADGAARSANRGFHLQLAPGILLPQRDDGPYGGGLALDARYGIQAGPLVLAPGGRVAGYLISSRGIAIAMPTFRVTVPVGPLAPYLVGGIGAGWLTNDSEAGLAWRGGGGLMIHLGRVFAIGAEITYQEVTGTDFRGLHVGPMIAFGG